MNFIVCDGVWESAGQTPVCVGTLSTMALSEISPSGLTAEDHAQLRDNALILFAIVFGALVLKKALKL
ncbi:hypothetical protein SAMN05216600_116108 [Pseudomonas cuatrocienegasensis]|jgi:hypothetical protein|uniref:Uncharacterized protein n=1 Tax=Pseudomonas cuatrocienegasensis TaxID=543360 RepID=A0ABY1BM54_9PSED|nr:MULTISPECIES: hypothetical protein [Pseudomonas]OEC35175.1 hypothetical protein A7D25_10060 [Pseudomonas sp. 21C1]SER16814.1 hypothetical protein SAMN05216600_116108 [Pseudomonas cuatrocienegasensis]